MSDDEAMVTKRLAASGIRPREAELGRLVKAFVSLGLATDALYTVADNPEEVPALLFDPDPVFDDW